MKKILFVEDDSLSQKLISRILAKHFEITICSSGEQFLEKHNKTKFDLVIMDISLEGQYDGLELTKMLRNDELHKNTPVLCLTAHAFQKDHDNAIAAGVDRFITKPIPPEKLREIIDELMQISQTNLM